MGRSILVTGAARGIGQAVAAAALAAGARVALTDIDRAPCEEAASRLGEGAIAAVLDVAADGATVAQSVMEVAERLGGLDGVVNNAAMLDEGSADMVSDQRFAEVLSVNLTSILRVSQAALPLMGAGGSIVNTLSTQALFGQRSSAAYASAKAGGAGLTRAMAVDFAPRGIRVNAVAPGFVDTRMAITSQGYHEHEDEAFRRVYLDGGRIPLGRPGTPADCAGAFVFLLSSLSDYITGQILVVDGGLTATY